MMEGVCYITNVLDVLDVAHTDAWQGGTALYSVLCTLYDL